ncbi:MAG: DUF3429 domain-containing protein [Gammaproteobacteria bacterium]|nr:DUF3429 domain-containing protein [Gammaproteobacteria bacterium]
MANSSYFNDQFRSLLSAVGYLGVLPFYAFMLLTWFGSSIGYDGFEPIWLFRFYAISILAFMTGTLWSIAFAVQPENETFEFKPAGLIFGSVFVVLAGFGLLIPEPKVGVFVTALLFLVLWQIELKTNLARLYPEWYWVLRTKLTMAVALAHILLWLTLG